jgi:hypothetical protein
MKHIFGMAKSSLDLRGAKSRNLELDFLRLVYVVEHYRRRGEEAQGYLAVLSEVAAQRVNVWVRKYETRSLVTCIPCSLALAVGEKDVLQSEKAANLAGMIAGTQRETVAGRSDATVGRQIGERFLRKAILEAEPGVREITHSPIMPFGVRWDFYGTLGAADTPFV